MRFGKHCSVAACSDIVQVTAIAWQLMRRIRLCHVTITLAAHSNHLHRKRQSIPVSVSTELPMRRKFAFHRPSFDA